MISFILLIILSIVDILVPYFICSFFVEKKYDMKIGFMLFFISFILHFINIHFIIIQINMLVLFIGLERKYFLENDVKLFYPILLFVAFQLFSIFICNVIIGSIMNIPFSIVDVLRLNNYTYLIYEFILSLILMILLNVKQTTHNKMKKIKRKLYMTIMLIGITLCILLAQTYFNEKISPMIVYSFFGGVLLYLVFIIFSFFQETSKAESEKELIHEEYRLNKLMLDNLIENQNDYEEFQKYKHDIENNLITLQFLHENDSQDKAKEYLAEIVGRFEKIEVIPQISIHPIINAVLVNKIRKNNHIKFNVNCMISKNINIDDVDINILLTNLIDNAVEYLNVHTVKKEIDIKIIERGSMYLIFVENTVENQLNNIDFKTSKKDKKNHGYGLSIIKTIVNKYNGLLDLKIKENRFCVKVLLKECTINSKLNKFY